MEVGCLFFENRTKGIIGQLWRDFWWKPAGWSGYRSVLFNKLNLEPRSTPLQRCETESLQLLSDILPPYLSIDVATIWILSPLEHFLSNFLSINKTDSRCSLTAEMFLLLKKKKKKNSHAHVLYRFHIFLSQLQIFPLNPISLSLTLSLELGHSAHFHTVLLAWHFLLPYAAIFSPTLHTKEARDRPAHVCELSSGVTCRGLI